MGKELSGTLALMSAASRIGADVDLIGRTGRDDGPAAPLHDSFKDAPPDVFSFGAFTLSMTAQRLELDGAAIPVGSRALALLVALLRRAGETVTKTELTAAVWPGLSVDDGNLRYHVATLRRVLGDGKDGRRFIKNISGRGYRFVAQVVRRTGDGPCSFSTERALARPPIDIVGREEEGRAIVSDLIEGRVVTIVGPGGVGKTILAQSAAHQIITTCRRALLFFDLGALPPEASLADIIAAAAGPLPDGCRPLDHLLSTLRSQRTLIILDNCEHLMETAATIAENIARSSPETMILATSREALRIAGEYVYRLHPLAVPPAGVFLTSAQMRDFSAVRLFIDRLNASGARLQIDELEIDCIVGICRRLDGLPLALELAAAQAAAFGLRDLAALLDGGAGLLWRGRRTAVPRHQTLMAALTWSYDLLSPTEQETLTRCADLHGEFSMSEVQAADGSLSGARAAEVVAALVAKSLVSARIEDGRTRYSLPATTRSYLRTVTGRRMEARRPV